MPDTRVDLDFADGRYSFWLALPHVIELERKAGGKSIFRMYDEMGAGLGLSGADPVYLGGGDAKASDIRDVIRLGLQGGNSGTVDGADIEVGPRRANELVEVYTFPNRPMIEGLHLAWSILHAAIVGIDLKKKAGRGNDRKPQPLRKGQLIANCGGMHLDWERLSLSGYFEALEAHNEAHQPAGGNSGAVDPDRLRRFMQAHRGN